MDSSPASPSSPAAHAAAVGGGRRRARRRRGVHALRDALREDPEFKDRFPHWTALPPRPARTTPFPDRLAPELIAAEKRRGIESLFAHQARAIEAALDGRDVLVATPTASGKTLAYVLPVLQSLIESGGAARTLFLYPTKALAQDQCTNLTSLVTELTEASAELQGDHGAPPLGEGWHAYTYDGDTPPSVRRTLRDRGNLILTNPYMLHAGILPNHPKWAELFRDLRYIVIDEVHTLSGVFGSSVANVLRRLVRIARHYGSDPVFLGTSATLPDAEGHARRLFGRSADHPIEVVDKDGSPAGERLFGLYNPPLVDPVAGLRANALEEARRLARYLCGPDHQTIFFARRRTSVEVLTRYLKESAADFGLRPEEIRGYRGGYLPLLRREVEGGLRDGSVKVVISTNALELGIDIGLLDVCVLVGYPGTQASFWQRAGRVGRRNQPSLCVQISRSDPIDQFLARHPDRLLGPPRERLALDPDNLVLLSEQLKCAAFELPFRQDENGELLDHAYGNCEAAPAILDYLAEESGFLMARGDTWHWTSDAYPAQDVSLAGADPDNVVIVDVDTNKQMGEIDREASLTTVHEGAIYSVQGETYVVERFDHANRRAYIKAVDVDHFTEAQTDVEVRVLRLEACLQRTIEEPEGERVDASVWRGEVHVTSVATQYKKIRFYTRENVGCGEIHLPPEELDSEAFMLSLSPQSAVALGLAPPPEVQTAEGAAAPPMPHRGAAWRGVGSLLRRVAPLFVRCQPSDLGLSTQVRSPHFKRPTIFLWDSVQGGVGLAEALFDCHQALLRAALDVVLHCPCENGCPACVGPVEEVGALGKEVAERILDHLVREGVFQPVELPEIDES